MRPIRLAAGRLQNDGLRRLPSRWTSAGHSTCCKARKAQSSWRPCSRGLITVSTPDAIGDGVVCLSGIDRLGSQPFAFGEGKLLVRFSYLISGVLRILLVPT